MFIFLNLKKENKFQCLVEENGKILDLNNIEFILSEYEEYEIVSYLIRKLTEGENKKIKRILIIGEDLIRIYPEINMIFPNSKFFITSKSRDIVNSFIKHYNKQKNYFAYTLDVLNGASLHDFIYNNSKFDLVIANKIFSKVKKKKRYFSVKFLYKYYLNQNGILCLINYIRNSKIDKFILLKTIKPALEKRIPLKNKNCLVQFISYIKKTKYV